MNRAVAIALADPAPTETPVYIEWIFLYTVDVIYSDIRRILFKVKPAPYTPLGAYQTGLDQGLEYLGQKSRGHFLGGANILFQDDLTRGNLAIYSTARTAYSVARVITMDTPYDFKTKISHSLGRVLNLCAMAC